MATINNIVSSFDCVCNTHEAFISLQHFIENDQLLTVFAVINAQMAQNLSVLGNEIESYISDCHIKDTAID